MKLLRNLAVLFLSGLIVGAVLAQTPQQTAIKNQAELVQLRLQHDIDALDHLTEFRDYLTQMQALEQLKQQYDAAGQMPAAAPAAPSRTAPSTPTPAGPTPGK